MAHRNINILGLTIGLTRVTSSMHTGLFFLNAKNYDVLDHYSILLVWDYKDDQKRDIITRASQRSAGFIIIHLGSPGFTVGTYKVHQ